MYLPTSRHFSDAEQQWRTEDKPFEIVDAVRKYLKTKHVIFMGHLKSPKRKFQVVNNNFEVTTT